MLTGIIDWEIAGWYPQYWEYANLLNTLRESFDKDLKELLHHTAALKDLKDSDCNEDKKCIERLTNLRNFFAKDEGRYLLAALKIGDGAVSGSKIPDILHEVAGPDILGGLTAAIAIARAAQRRH